MKSQDEQLDEFLGAYQAPQSPEELTQRILSSVGTSPSQRRWWPHFAAAAVLLLLVGVFAYSLRGIWLQEQKVITTNEEEVIAELELLENLEILQDSDFAQVLSLSDQDFNELLGQLDEEPKAF